MVEGDHTFAVQAFKEHGVTAVKIEFASVMLPLPEKRIALRFKNEVAFRQEVVLGIVNLVAAVITPIPLTVRLSMITLWVLLICVELLNSAIEAVVNIASPQFHELAKRAKDYGSAADF